MKNNLTPKLCLIFITFTTTAFAQNVVKLGPVQRLTTQKEFEDAKFSKGAWCDMFIGKKCSLPYTDANGDKRSKVVPCNGPAKALNKNIKSAASFVGMEPASSPEDSALMLLVGMAGEGMNAMEPNLEYSGYDFKPDGTPYLTGDSLIVTKRGPLPDGSPTFKENYLKKNNLVYSDGWKDSTIMGKGLKFTDGTDDDGSVQDGSFKGMMYADSWEGTGADNFFRESKRLMAQGLLPKEYQQEIDKPLMLKDGFISKTNFNSEGKGLPNFMFAAEGCNELKNVPRYVDSHPGGTRKDPEDLVNNPFYDFRPGLTNKTSEENNQKNNAGTCKTSKGVAAFGVYCQGLNVDNKSPDCGTTHFTNAEAVTYATAALWKDSQKRFRSMEKVLRARYPNFKRPLKDEEIVFWTKVYFNGGQGSQASADVMFQYYAENNFLNSDDYLYQAPSCASPCSMIPIAEIWQNARVSMDTYMVLKKRMENDPKYCLNNDENFPEKDGKNYDLNLKSSSTQSTSGSQGKPE